MRCELCAAFAQDIVSPSQYMQASANNVAECERLLAAGIDPRAKAEVFFSDGCFSAGCLSSNSFLF